MPAGDPEAAATPPSPMTHAGAAPDEADHERQLEHDLEELAAKAGKADQYLDAGAAHPADFENYRKRATRDAAAAQERGIAQARQGAAARGRQPRPRARGRRGHRQRGGRRRRRTATLVSGIKLVHEDVIAALARVGIERFSPEGERFDPQLHEAVAQQPVDGAESGTVVEVYQRGYRLGEVVIRPARVVVAA